MTTTELEINKELVVSTCHISEETSRFLTEIQPHITVDDYDYGYCIFIPGDDTLASEEADTIRNLGRTELADLMALAKKHECKWLVLDCDGPEVSGLPTFDW